DLLFSVIAQHLQAPSQNPVQPGSAHLRKTSIDHLPKKRVPKFVMRRDSVFTNLLNPSGLDESLPFRQSFAKLLNLVRRHVERGTDNPDGEAISKHAGALQNPLLRRRQVIKLKFQHLLKRFWHAGIDILHRPRKSPAAMLSRYQILFRQFLNDRR